MPISTIGFVTLGFFFAAERLNRPAATAESDLESTHVNRTGMTPSTKVRSSRMYFVSSDASSRIRSPMVAVASRLRLVRMLRADIMLLEPPLGIESTDMRSAWLASFRLALGPLRLRVRLVFGSKVSSDTEAGASPGPASVCVATSEPSAMDGGAACIFVANVSTDAMVERRLPVDGNARLMGKPSGRDLIVRLGRSTVEASTEDEGAVDATSSSCTRSCSGNDLIRSLVGEC